MENRISKYTKVRQIKLKKSVDRLKTTAQLQITTPTLNQKIEELLSQADSKTKTPPQPTIKYTRKLRRTETAPSSQWSRQIQEAPQPVDLRRKMSPTVQRPASANFQTQISFSRRQSQTKVRLPDRVPVRLLFKTEKLENIAQQNLKSRTVMAMSNLTVK